MTTGDPKQREDLESGKVSAVFVFLTLLTVPFTGEIITIKRPKYEKTS